MLNKNTFKYFFFVILFFFVIFSFKETYHEYFLSRLMTSPTEINLSRVLYLEGWDRSFVNFKETLGFGLGFQQFGIHGSISPIRIMIENYSPQAVEMNLFDGTFVAAKLIGELGIIGLLLLSLYTLKAISVYKWLKNIIISNHFNSDARDIFFASHFIMFFIDIYFRGAGYFSSSGFFFLSSVFWIYIRFKKLQHV
jgi:hypothetical protein